MLEAILNAKERIYLMSYIFKVDTAGTEFIKALGDAKRRGVEVKVVLDGIIDWLEFPRASKLLRDEGVEVEKFLTIDWFPPSLGINLRNHKKLMLVDDESAFTGGMNITDLNWEKSLHGSVLSQDLHYFLQGPVIEQMYALFSEVWCFITGEDLEYRNQDYIKKGNAVCRAFVDGPDEELDKIELILLASIATATDSVRLMTPYFFPSPAIVSALCTAALRGVNVDVILPVKSDNRITDYATRNFIGKILNKGSKYLFPT